MTVAGLDVGGSVTKGVLINRNKILSLSEVQSSDPIASAMGCLAKLLAESETKIRDLSEIALTGSLARKFKLDAIEVNYNFVNEIDAIGIGGLYLSQKKEAIVVSVGTGTAIVHAKIEKGRYSIEHLGGTGIGGGTLVGLSKLLLNKDQPTTVFKMAKLGDISKTSLLVFDIVAGPLGKIPASATASNFGKVGDDTKPEDIALGLITMVAQTVATMAYFAAKEKNLGNEIVFVGKLPSQELFAEKLTETLKVFGTTTEIPKNAPYATAIGAAKARVPNIGFC